MPQFQFFLRWLLLAVLGLFISASVNAQEAMVAKASGGAGTDFRSKLEQETFLLVNQYRKENKLPPFKWSDDIAVVARAHSKDMAMDKVGFGHGGFGDRVKELKSKLPGLNGAGENVLKTDDPDDVAKGAVRVWLHSPHHLANIRGDFNYSGMGVWRDDNGVIYFTQFFVKIVPPVAQPAQVTPPPTVVSPFPYLAEPKTR